MNKPHKHAELIKQWADGASIEVKDNDGSWVDVTLYLPVWADHQEYRIKPETKPDVILHSHINNYTSVMDMGYYDVKLNNTGQVQDHNDNVRLTFDGETGKLKAVELL